MQQFRAVLLQHEHKQSWINHLERMDNTRLQKHALNYTPRGRRDLGRPSKRWQRVDAGKGQPTLTLILLMWRIG